MTIECQIVRDLKLIRERHAEARHADDQQMRLAYGRCVGHLRAGIRRSRRVRAAERAAALHRARAAIEPRVRRVGMSPRARSSRRVVRAARAAPSDDDSSHQGSGGQAP